MEAGAQLKVSSNRLNKLEIEPAIPGLSADRLKECSRSDAHPSLYNTAESHI